MLKNVPLDKKHTDTYWFASADEQAEAFKLYTKGLPFDNLTYQRVNKGEVIVKRKADDLYDCNYMMFQNTNYGTKWFYAFIDKVEYVSNVACKVFYTIDTLQTWLKDIKFRECFVEREHSETDEIGENLVPEKLELGEYICDDWFTPDNMTDYAIVVAATFNKDGEDIVGGSYAGIYSGLRLNVFEDNGSNSAAIAVSEFIEENNSKADGIVSVFMMPKFFTTEPLGRIKSFDFECNKNNTHFIQFDDQTEDGRTIYEPRNKKLLTYPYNFLYVTNLEGNCAVFPYEFFSTDKCKFVITGDFSCNPTVLLAPYNYKGLVLNYDEKISISGFPQCSFNTDTYKAWLAQSAVSIPTSAIGTAQSMMLMSTVPVVGQGAAIATGVVGALGAIGQAYEHFIMPNQARGNAANSAQVAMGIKNFAFIPKHITIEYAKIIDEFFDMYGYATNRVKKPNLFDSNKTPRKYWNYIKTRDCNIVGGIPSDDKQAICDIFNNGVRFWTWGSLLTAPQNAQIGEYSKLNNTV